MEYREIVAVNGLSGLFQLKATKSDGVIVKSLDDGSTKFLPARLHTVTQLESIEVYTIADNVLLHHVFQSMKDNDDEVRPDVKKSSNDEIKNYFKSVYPDFDFDRVYISDMKKMLKWYSILKKSDLLHFEIKNQEEVAEEVTDTKTEEQVSQKAKSKKVSEEDITEEKPKKTSKKKKEE